MDGFLQVVKVNLSPCEEETQNAIHEVRTRVWIRSRGKSMRQRSHPSNAPVGASC